MRLQCHKNRSICISVTQDIIKNTTTDINILLISYCLSEGLFKYSTQNEISLDLHFIKAWSESSSLFLKNVENLIILLELLDHLCNITGWKKISPPLKNTLKAWMIHSVYM